jgi:hypothetical protein
MNNKQTFYFLPIALFAVLGLFMSLVHHHSVGLECLEHADGSHVLQTEDFCPIFTLVTDDDFSTPFTFEVILSSDNQVIILDSEKEFDTFIPSKSGRSPPFLA